MTDYVYFIVTDDRGHTQLNGTETDAERAEEHAFNIGGVVAALPIVADFRPGAKPVEPALDVDALREAVEALASMLAASPDTARDLNERYPGLVHGIDRVTRFVEQPEARQAASAEELDDLTGLNRAGLSPGVPATSAVDAGDWRPMETAPHDGTTILLCDPAEPTIVNWSTEVVDSKPVSGWVDLDRRFVPWIEPGTRWRPLTEQERREALDHVIATFEAQTWRPAAEAPRDGTPVMTRTSTDPDDGNTRILYSTSLRDDGRSPFVWADALDDVATGEVVGEADPVEWRPLTEDEYDELNARLRMAADSGRRHSLEDVAAEAGIDLEALGDDD